MCSACSTLSLTLSSEATLFLFPSPISNGTHSSSALLCNFKVTERHSVHAGNFVLIPMLAIPLLFSPPLILDYFLADMGPNTAEDGLNVMKMWAIWRKEEKSTVTVIDGYLGPSGTCGT